MQRCEPAGWSSSPLQWPCPAPAHAWSGRSGQRRAGCPAAAAHKLRRAEAVLPTLSVVSHYARSELRAKNNVRLATPMSSRYSTRVSVATNPSTKSHHARARPNASLWPSRETAKAISATRQSVSDVSIPSSSQRTAIGVTRMPRSTKANVQASRGAPSAAHVRKLPRETGKKQEMKDRGHRARQHRRLAESAKAGKQPHVQQAGGPVVRMHPVVGDHVMLQQVDSVAKMDEGIILQRPATTATATPRAIVQTGS